MRSGAVLLFFASFSLSLICGCTSERANFRRAAQLTGGNPRSGRAKLLHYGCASCHTIPGVSGAEGLVGPPLNRFGSRVYIAGELPNTPANLMRWIQKPHDVEQHTAMPDMGVTDEDSRDIAAYLYSLR